MIKDLECPYCEEFNEEPEECNEQEETYFCTCEHCNKTFGYTFSYYKSFSEFETPCQNEDETGKEISHKWVKRCGTPSEYYHNKYRCEYCSEEKTFTDEEIKKLENI